MLVWYGVVVCRQDLTATKDQSESKGRKRGLEEVPSFFLWFTETDGSSDPIAEIIKDDIWPNPLQFFLVSSPSVINNFRGSLNFYAFFTQGGGDLNETYEEEEEEEGEEELDDEEDDDDPVSLSMKVNGASSVVNHQCF